jgi:DNA-binding Lrp family transcriptional regulator
MRDRVLKLLSENARISYDEIAERLDITKDKAKNYVEEMEAEGIIRGYRAVVDEKAVADSVVRAIIEVKVRPERDGGFNNIAKRLSKFPEIVSLYLVSGGYDLQLEVKGDTLQNVAEFVSRKLATIDGVISTATHFLLKKYKESGKILHDEDEYERLKITP